MSERQYLTDADLGALEAALVGTRFYPEPWKACWTTAYGGLWQVTNDSPDGPSEEYDVTEDWREQDARFVALAHNEFPRLLAAARDRNRLEIAVADLTERLAHEVSRVLLLAAEVARLREGPP